jgi:RNA-directed DNA polymerase
MPVEGRGLRRRELSEGNTGGTQRPTTLTTKLAQVAKVAKERPKERFTSLAHLMDEELLKRAWERTRKDGAAGVDGKTAKWYAANLKENLTDLCTRFRSGGYQAPPVRRAYIEKDDGRKRPLGIPTVEDKVAQRAVAILLETVYEQDFLPCSYGFRPKRSAHQALAGLQGAIVMKPVRWVLEIDIEDFFGTMNHEWLRKMVQHRIKDGALNRLIGRWLRAGVMEDGAVTRTDLGTPQGGVISPILGNLYLHHVIDLWFEKKVKKTLQKESYLFRYADDAVFCFESRKDAEEVLELLRERLSKFGLKLNAGKTRMIRFGRWAEEDEGSRPETFHFLGFTHHVGRTRAGKFTVKRRTMAKRLGRAKRRVTDWCRQNRHLKVNEQRDGLNAILRGHNGYYGITGNYECLEHFYLHVTRTWRSWLDRRGRRGSMPWDRFNEVLKRLPLVRPTIVHSVYAT